jgi:hypothetical protein
MDPPSTSCDGTEDHSNEYRPLCGHRGQSNAENGGTSETMINWLSDVEGASQICHCHGLVTGPSSPIHDSIEWIKSSFFCCRASSGANMSTMPVTDRRPIPKRNMQAKTIKILKKVGSLALLCFSVYLIMAAIFTRQTKVSHATGPIVASGIMWSLVLWLGLMEGGQGSLVGLQPVDKALYAKTHPIAHRCATLAHQGENLNKFILGRQFLVFLLVFVVNMCAAPLPGTKIPGVPQFLVEILLESGLATIFITVILGQLAAEVNATKCMFDFINSYAMLFTLWLSLAIEHSGILHSVYVVQHGFAWATGKSISTDTSDQSLWSRIFFWGRVSFSTLLLGFACVLTGAAVFHGQTDMYPGIPNAATAVLLLILLGLIGMMEGMQIALFAVVNLPTETLKHHAVARANCDLTFAGNNFQAFLIGRQVCVTFALFILATILTIDVDLTPLRDGTRPLTVMGVNEGMQEFLNSGLPGALVTTILASLAWRIIASSFPIAFMSSPLVSLSIHFCLLLEATGLFSSAWTCAAAHKQLVGFKSDEDYIGKPIGHKHQPHDSKEESLSDSDSDTECTDEEAASIHIRRLDSTTSSISSVSTSGYGATSPAA